MTLKGTRFLAGAFGAGVLLVSAAASGHGTARAANPTSASSAVRAQGSGPAVPAPAQMRVAPQNPNAHWSPAVAGLSVTSNPKVTGTANPRRSASPPANGAGSGLIARASDGFAISLAERPRFNQIRVPDSDGVYQLIERTPTTGPGAGYWMVSSFGAVRPFGDAHYYGDAENPNVSFSGDIVGMAATPSGQGYYLVSSAGDVLFAGDAKPFGSLNDPRGLVIGIAIHGNDDGYWLGRADGSVAAFGNASATPPQPMSWTGNPVGTYTNIRSDGASGFYLVSTGGTVLGLGPQLACSGNNVLGATSFDVAPQLNVGYRVMTSGNPPFSCFFAGATPSACMTGQVQAPIPSAAGNVTMVCTPDGNGWWYGARNGQVTRAGTAAELGSATGVEVAALLDPDPLANSSALSAVVNWGDGTSDAGMIKGANGNSTGSYFLIVAPAHTWSSFGYIPITVTATDTTDPQTVALQVSNVVITPEGYWLVASDGGIFPFGGAAGFGSTGNVRLNQPIVGMAVSPFGFGYWLVASDGGIFPFGDAVKHSYGSTGSVKLNQPIVGMARTASGNGYWLVASDGGIFPFGDAGGFGSTGNVKLNKPIVGMAPTASGNGYWLVASDGGIFPFGDAVSHSYGSTGNVRLNQPIVAMARALSGNGYWMVARDGGIFPFGPDAGGYGSTGNIKLNQPIVGMSPSGTGKGYWLVASDGGIFPFGDAIGYGSTGNLRLNKPINGMGYNP